jgi:hypothetical protein
MTSIKQTYGVPDQMPTPVAVRVWIFPALIFVVAVGGWLLLPHTPVVAGLLTLAVIVIVGVGVARIMASRQLNDLPGRKPVKPPSTGGD